MQVELKGFLYWHKASYMDEPEYIIREADSYASSCGPEYALVGPYDTTVEIPDDFDPLPQLVDNMRQQKSKILAEAQVKANNIEEQIQRMLCIEHKPEAA